MDAAIKRCLARRAYHRGVWLQMSAAANEVSYCAEDLVIVRYAATQASDWPRDIALRADVFVESVEAADVVRQVRCAIGAGADHILHLPADVVLAPFEALGYAWCWTSELMVKELLQQPSAIGCDRHIQIRSEQIWCDAHDGVPGNGSAIHKLVASEAGGYRGHVHLLAMPGGVASLADLEVLSVYRGRGIGRMLISAAESQARAAGKTLMVLHPSPAATQANFYGRQGYAAAGEVRLMLSGHRGSSLAFGHSLFTGCSSERPRRAGKQTTAL